MAEGRPDKAPVHLKRPPPPNAGAQVLTARWRESLEDRRPGPPRLRPGCFLNQHRYEQRAGVTPWGKPSGRLAVWDLGTWDADLHLIWGMASTDLRVHVQLRNDF